jgi:hypothetical protein
MRWEKNSASDQSWIAMYPERYVKGYTNKFDELDVGEDHERQVIIDLRNLKTVTPLHLRIYIRVGHTGSNEIRKPLYCAQYLGLVGQIRW